MNSNFKNGNNYTEPAIVILMCIAIAGIAGLYILLFPYIAAAWK